MIRITKSGDDLTRDDYRQYPIWEYTNEENPGEDETWVTPVLDLPVTTLSNRLVATELRLNNGTKIPAILSNIDLGNPFSTSHFILVSVYSGDREFVLAHYSASDYLDHGPCALAAFLGLPVDDVFPMTYDISDLAIGDTAALQGTIYEEHPAKLSDHELTILALRGDDSRQGAL